MYRSNPGPSRRQQKARRRTVTIATLVLIGGLIAGCTVMKSKTPDNPGTTAPVTQPAKATTLQLPAEATGGAQVGVQSTGGQLTLLQQQGGKWAETAGPVKVGDAEIRIMQTASGPLVVRAGHLPPRDKPFDVLLKDAKVVPAAGGEPTFQAWTVSGGQLQAADYYAAVAPKPAAANVIMVDKGINALWLYKDNKLVMTKRVATGRYLEAPYPTAQNQAVNSITPLGQFKIGQKIVNPVYFHDNIPGGDPKNPLGTRFMGFSVFQGDGAGIWAIHGTNEPDLIGKWVSDGCIRMPTKDAEALFDQVDVGTQLVIFDTVHKS